MTTKHSWLYNRQKDIDESEEGPNSHKAEENDVESVSEKHGGVSLVVEHLAMYIRRSIAPLISWGMEHIICCMPAICNMGLLARRNSIPCQGEGGGRHSHCAILEILVAKLTISPKVVPKPINRAAKSSGKVTGQTRATYAGFMKWHVHSLWEIRPELLNHNLTGLS